MKLNYHNEIKIRIGKNEFVFYNTMLESVYQKIVNFESYFDKIVFGNGKSQNIISTHKLESVSCVSNLETQSLQADISSGTAFVKKILTLNPKNFKTDYITEAGITSNLDDENNPTIYNYFSFISENNPNGIYIGDNDPIIISVCIYLNISTSEIGLFTKGNNKFIEFLLGFGLDSKIYAARGNNLSPNIYIEHSNAYTGNKFECSILASINNGVAFEFDADLGVGETNEIVFLADETVFARINTYDLQKSTLTTVNYTPKRNFIVDLGKGITSIGSIINNATNTQENNYFVVKYAANFAGKIKLPFNNIFDINTPRFISKDGDKIFFILNDYIYMYQNENYMVLNRLAVNLQIKNIIKLVSFDDFVFIFTKEAPYIHAYQFNSDYTLCSCSFNLSSFDAYESLSLYTEIDIVQGKNGTFLLGFIAPVNIGTAYTLYFTFDEANKSFIFDSYVYTSDQEYTYLLAFHKNNFSDAEMLYLQPGATSSKCKRALHGLDKSVTTTYSSTSYYYTYKTTSICVKSRAVVMEKDYSPNFWLYYYPQIYRFSISIFGDAIKNYISTNLLYLIQKLPDGSYRAYNLIGYDTPEEFSLGIPDEIDQNKILYIEFLIDTVLFFMDDENEPIIAYSLNTNGTCIENVSSRDNTYLIETTRKEILGDNNEGVAVKLTANINI